MLSSEQGVLLPSISRNEDSSFSNINNFSSQTFLLYGGPLTQERVSLGWLCCIGRRLSLESH